MIAASDKWKQGEREKDTGYMFYKLCKFHNIKEVLWLKCKKQKNMIDNKEIK